jgi:hypothetical protein
VSAESEAAFLIALEDYRIAVATSPVTSTTALTIAAQDHVGASRSASEVAAEYTAANADPDASAELVQELAQELNSARIAEAITDGNLPYRPPVVTTGD